MKEILENNRKLITLVGIIFIIWNLYVIFSDYRLTSHLEKNGILTTAQEYNFHPNKLLGFKCLGSMRYFSYNIKFIDQNGHTVIKKQSKCSSSSPSLLSNSREVTIIYNPKNLDEFIYSNNKFGSFISSVVLIIIGLFLVFSGKRKTTSK